MMQNRGAVLLLDEPDAHLEILRQRQIYRVLVETAREHGSQVIVASHSEVILNEAADRDVVIAFVGRPHRIGDRGNQALKSLKEIGFEQYYQAKRVRCSTWDRPTWLSFQTFAAPLVPLNAWAIPSSMKSSAAGADHLFGLRDAKPDLVGFVLCDRLDRPPQPTADLDEHQWNRREIELPLPAGDAADLCSDVDAQANRDAGEAWGHQGRTAGDGGHQRLCPSRRPA
ncbi:MAG: AAA family ATPase [Dehalococcoidia bacterium]